MNEIMHTNTEAQEGVLARTIWAGLGFEGKAGSEPKYQYGNWFNDQVARFGLAEHRDYEVFKVDLNNPSGGRPRLDHMLSQAAAVKIQAGNQKVANAISQKVGEMELQKHTQKPKRSEVEILANAAALIGDLQAMICDKQDQIEFQQPYVAFASRVQESDSFTGVSAAAKMMNIPGLGPVNFFKWLRENKILLSDESKWNMPYQEYIERGYLVVKLANKNGQNIPVSMFTGKGLIWVQKQLVNGALLIDESEEIIPCE